ncbi:hypothetical protein GPALN_006555 [Globodera pallida]|nr:hypothetical protein GPALN_006555 [Globodera pallida]
MNGDGCCWGATKVVVLVSPVLSIRLAKGIAVSCAASINLASSLTCVYVPYGTNSVEEPSTGHAEKMLVANGYSGMTWLTSEFVVRNCLPGDQ